MPISLSWGCGTTRHNLLYGKNHFRHQEGFLNKTIGTSGCSTSCMKTVLKWLGNRRLDLNGLIAERRFTLDDDPHEFFTTEADGRKPALCPRVK